ncbi:MAG: hypothetical protein ACRDFW_11235 [bacterium]
MTARDVKALAKLAYPDYAGRKFRVCSTRRTYSMADYWSDGSRNFAVAVDLATGRIVEPREAAHNPLVGRAAHATFEIPAGVGILERAVFCGRQLGITLYVAPAQALATAIDAA